MPQYSSLYKIGEVVRIKNVDYLNEFKKKWKYHNPILDSMIAQAGKEMKIIDVGYYHGGDPLYQIAGSEGFWHEECLEKIL
jgi:hypothetical protein